MIRKEMASILALVMSVSVVASESKPKSNVVSEVNFDAEFYIPQGKTRSIAILVLGGAEGGIPRSRAKIISEKGFPTLALGYFKTERTPEYLDMVPLEYFDEPIKWLQVRPETKGKKIVVIGGSKGGELALLLASRKPEIKGVVASVPSSVVFQGIPKVFWPPRSSWSYEGKPVPFVPYDYSKGFDPKRLLGLYQNSLAQQDFVKKAVIQVEKIKGPVLLFSATDDQMWPSVEMCVMICRRLQEKGFKHKYEHIKYDNAGHTLNEYFMLGGTKEENREARLDSTKRMFEFLNRLAEQSAAADADKPRR